MVKSIFATVVIGSLSFQAFAAPPMLRTMSRKAEMFQVMSKQYEREVMEKALNEDLKKLSKSKDAEVQVMVMSPADVPPPRGNNGFDGGLDGADGPKKPSKNSPIEFRTLSDKEVAKYYQYLVTNRSTPGVVAQEKFRDKTLGDTIFRVQDSFTIENSFQKSLTTVRKNGPDLELEKKFFDGSNTGTTKNMTFDASIFGGDLIKFSAQGDRLNVLVRRDGKFEQLSYVLPEWKEIKVKDLQVVSRESLTPAELKKLGLVVGIDLNKLKADKSQLFRSQGTTAPFVKFEPKDNSVR